MAAATVVAPEIKNETKSRETEDAVNDDQINKSRETKDAVNDEQINKSRETEDATNDEQIKTVSQTDSTVVQRKKTKTEKEEKTEDDVAGVSKQNEAEISTKDTPRVSGDGGTGLEETINRINSNEPFFPGSAFGNSPELVDLNYYQHKKTLAKGMMDLALFSANANQLRYVMECRDRHPYFYPAAILISFSLFCQVGVGLALLWNSMYNVKHQMQQANRANNYTVIGIFLVTVINVFVSAFGVANPPPAT